MLNVSAGRLLRQVPESWDELTPAQYLAAVRVLHSPAPLVHLRLALLAIIAPMPAWLTTVLTRTQLATALAWTHFLLPPTAPAPAPPADTDTEAAPAAPAPVGPRRQLLPVLRLPWRRDPLRRAWHGPAGHLRNQTFGEFIFADTYFLRYHATRDAAVLDKLVATLYRPAGWRWGALAAREGDRRQAFSEHRIERHAARLRHLPLPTKLAVLLWFAACRQQLQAEFADVFAPAPVGGTAGADWGGVLRKLSGGAFGTVQQTAAQPVRLVLAEFQDQVRAADQARRAARSAR